MKREIKFRAWDKTNKKMYFPRSIIIDDPDLLKDHIFMQYTGFTDAGGEELYSGDIFEDDAEWFTVGWSDEDGAWYAFGIRDRGGNIDMQLSEFVESSTCWKQGNIFENPELLV